MGKLGMKKFSIIAAMVLLLCISTGSHASDDTDYSRIVKDYLAAKEAVQQEDSTSEDIEHMLGFMADDIQTEHKPHKTMECVNDGGGKEGFRAGLRHYLGQYDSTDIEILDITTGKNMAAVEFRETITYTRDGERFVDVSESLFVLEFNDGLIQREFRYDL